MSNLDDLFEGEAARLREEAERDDHDALYQMRQRNKRREDFEKGVRLGWWDSEGNTLHREEPDLEDEDEYPEDEDEDL